MRPVRCLSPGAVWLVTSRCELGQFFFLPPAGRRDIVGAWLVRALRERGDGIRLYAFSVLGNELGLLLCDTKGQLAEFMTYFKTNVAKAINHELGRACGHVFAKRYDAVLIDGQGAFEAAYAKVTASPVSAGLVAQTLDWPGLCSLEAALGSGAMHFEMLDQTAYHNATRRNKNRDRTPYMLHFDLELAIPPIWDGYSPRRRKNRIRQLVNNYEELHREARRQTGQGFVGIAGLADLEPTDRPAEVPSFAPRSYVSCQDTKRREELEEAWQETSRRYRQCYRRYRAATEQQKRTQLKWPPWTCPPTLNKPVGYEKAA